MFQRRSPGNFGSLQSYNWDRLYRPRRPRPREYRRYGPRAYYPGPEVGGWVDYGWIPDYLDYADAGSSDEFSAPQNYSDNEGEYSGEPGPPPWPSIYTYNRPSIQQPHPIEPSQAEEAVTLIFKDGRPSERIHNYAMTPTTLYVLDSPHRNIPLDQLNLSATEKINDQAGISFEVPGTSP
ncbi:MAG: hypothetical protein ACRD28_01210 [Acidobacteriaceae bacterium]